MALNSTTEAGSYILYLKLHVQGDFGWLFTVILFIYI